MSKYIDVEEIKNRLLQKGVEKSDIEFLLSVYKEHQEKNNILTADVRENIKGEWVEKDVTSLDDELDDENVIDEWQSAKCSICGRYHTTPYLYCFNNYNYCPHCGADMRGEKQ